MTNYSLTIRLNGYPLSETIEKAHAPQVLIATAKEFLRNELLSMLEGDGHVKVHTIEQRVTCFNAHAELKGIAYGEETTIATVTVEIFKL